MLALNCNFCPLNSIDLDCGKIEEFSLKVETYKRICKGITQPSVLQYANKIQNIIDRTTFSLLNLQTYNEY